METSVNSEENPSAVPKTPEKTVTVTTDENRKIFETAILLVNLYLATYIL